MGENAVMACTKAVERTVHRHLDDQIRFLRGRDEDLRDLIAHIQSEEAAHLAYAEAHMRKSAAARLIEAHADEATRAEWLDRLVSGEWAATICISEPDAGSDVGRIRTLARPDGAGGWQITGEKIWISYSDHDLAPRIGHCLLARTPDAPPGGAGLSLFLVPDGFPATGERNGVAVRRLEEKLGLHGSPTCALGFEDARGVLIGTPGRGLAQLFTMIATCQRHQVNAFDYLKDVLARIAAHPMNNVAELLPQRWQQPPAAPAAPTA